MNFNIKSFQVLSVLRTLVCLILSMVTLSAVAQQKRDWSFFLYGKMHSFYDPGVYEIGETNNATANGMGMSFAKPISKRVSLFGGYDFALADSLSYPLISNGWKICKTGVFLKIKVNFQPIHGLTVWAVLLIL